MSLKHIIQQLSFDIQYPHERDAYECLEEIREIIKESWVEVVEDVFDKVDDALEGAHIRINELSIDLGNIPLNDLKEDGKYKIKERLTLALLRAIQNIEQSSRRVQGDDVIVSPTYSDLELVIYYLEHGIQPWWGVKSSSESVVQLLERLLHEHPKLTFQALKIHWTSPQVIKRMFAQFDLPMLRKIILVIHQSLSIDKKRILWLEDAVTLLKKVPLTITKGSNKVKLEKQLLEAEFNMLSSTIKGGQLTSQHAKWLQELLENFIKVSRPNVSDEYLHVFVNELNLRLIIEPALTSKKTIHQSISIIQQTLWGQQKPQTTYLTFIVPFIEQIKRASKKDLIKTLIKKYFPSEFTFFDGFIAAISKEMTQKLGLSNSKVSKVAEVAVMEWLFVDHQTVNSVKNSLVNQQKFIEQIFQKITRSLGMPYFESMILMAVKSKNLPKDISEKVKQLIEDIPPSKKKKILENLKNKSINQKLQKSEWLNESWDELQESFQETLMTYEDLSIFEHFIKTGTLPYSAKELWEHDDVETLFQLLYQREPAKIRYLLVKYRVKDNPIIRKRIQLQFSEEFVRKIFNLIDIDQSDEEISKVTSSVTSVESFEVYVSKGKLLQEPALLATFLEELRSSATFRVEIFQLIWQQAAKQLSLDKRFVALPYLILQDKYQSGDEIVMSDSELKEIFNVYTSKSLNKLSESKLISFGFKTTEEKRIIAKSQQIFREFVNKIIKKRPLITSIWWSDFVKQTSVFQSHFIANKNFTVVKNVISKLEQNPVFRIDAILEIIQKVGFLSDRQIENLLAYDDWQQVGFKKELIKKMIDSIRKGSIEIEKAVKQLQSIVNLQATELSIREVHELVYYFNYLPINEIFTTEKIKELKRQFDDIDFEQSLLTPFKSYDQHSLEENKPKQSGSLKEGAQKKEKGLGAHEAEDKSIRKKKKQEELLSEPKPKSEPIDQSLFIGNAGLVILYPFMKPLFGKLELLENREFKDEQAAVRGVHLLQYLATGEEASPEYELVLNKILCGIDIQEPIEREIYLTDDEKNLCEELMRVMIGRWSVLKKTSPSAVRSMFLKREGKLTEDPGSYWLKVGWSSFDILIDSIPWGYKLIQLPWMEKMLQTEWEQV